MDLRGGRRGAVDVKRGTMHLTWIQDSGRAISTRVDVPSTGLIHGAVVLVPSVGREAVVAFRTMRALAVACAAAGFVAYSPALSGTGDSEDVGEHLAHAWRADVDAAVTRARGAVGPLPVHVIALRVGVTLLDGLSALPGEMRIAWEPVAFSTFLRRSLAVRRLTIPREAVPDAVEIPGAAYRPEEVEALKALTLPAPGSGVTVVKEPDRAVADKIASVSPHFAQIPVASIERLVDLLPTDSSAPMRPEVGTDVDVEVAARIAVSTGVAVLERHVLVGPHALPGVLTEPPEGMMPRRAVVFTAMGAELRSGPGDLWTRAARELAARGVVCLRVDRRYLGDALDTSSVTEPRPYTHECVDDVADAVRWLGERTALPVSGVGVCSGAWSFLRASTRVDIAEIVVVNNIDWDPDPTSYDESFYEQAFRFDTAMNDGLIDDGSDEDAPPGARAELARRFRSVRHRLGVRFPGVRAVLRQERVSTTVSVMLDDVPPSTRVYLVLGPKEHSRFTLLDGDRALSRASRRGAALQVRVREDFDHSMLSEGARRRLLADLLDILD